MAERTIAGKDDAGVAQGMYCVTDNFLSNDLFESLNKEMLNRFDPNEKWNDDPRYGKALSGDNFAEVGPIRYLYPHEKYGAIDSEYVNVAWYLRSPSLPQVTKNINERMNELNLTKPNVRSMWFQYQSKAQHVQEHTDPPLGGQTAEQSFTSILYMHDTWEENYKGEIVFSKDESTFLPKPNRLLIYSRDEAHRVNEITHDLEGYQRMLFFIGWGTE